MEGESSSKKISVVFVLEDGTDQNNVPRDMRAAHQCCVDQEVSTAWISSKECLKLKPKKTDIFVFEEFKGDSFAFLREFKCVIISPRCLMTCLVERKPIPNIPSPIFTIAMVDIIVTASGFTKDQKKALSDKIGLMGGVYLTTFNASVTHLVANAVGSQKYKVAAERGIPVMTEDWVNAVWNAGLKENVNALDPQFASHKLPAFKGLLICASQISKVEKQKLMTVITNNGGRYSAQLECKETGLLVIGDPSGAKYTFAKKWGIPCVTPQWIFDSASNGYSLPFDDYSVDGETTSQAKCSTPKMGGNLEVLPDFSMCSTIVGECSKFNINETISTEISMMTEQNTPKKGNGSKDYVNLVNKLDVSEAKKAGSFLDGCKIYLSGFSPSQVEKLRKIINGGGATRFHQMTESVSHVIVGDFMYEEMNTLKSGKFRPFVVRVDWLLESMQLGRVADEEKFLCFDLRPLEPPSPLSKKGLQLLQGGSMSGIAAVSNKLNVAESNAVDEGGKPSALTDERDLLQQYLGSNGAQDKPPEKAEAEKQREIENNAQAESKASVSNAEELQEEINSLSSQKLFQGLKFVVAGFNKSEEEVEVGEELQQMLVEYGGQVVVRRFRGIPDYGIVPIEGGQLPCTVGEVVTHLWLEDCHDQERIVPVEYFHRPFSLEPDCKPLLGCVVGISSYVGKERAFISSLAEALGAYSQEVFSKKDVPEKNAIASTHLVCPSPEGNKYAAAVKWGLPAVTKEWVLACAQKRQKLPEFEFLVTLACEKAVSKTPGSTMISSVLAKETPMEKKELPSGSGSERSNCKVSADITELVSAVQTNRNVNKEVTRETEENQHVTNRTPTAAVRMLSYSSAKSSSGSKKDFSTEEKQVVSKVDVLKKDDGFAGYNFTPPNCVDTHGCSKTNKVVDKGQDSGKELTISRGSEGAPGKEAKQQTEATPGTPYGCIFEAVPSNSTRKAWKNWVENIPRLHQATPQRAKEDPQTPYSELKRRLWASIEQVCDNIDAKTKVDLVSGEANVEELNEAQRKRKRADEPDERCWRRSRPLNGVIAYIWKELPKKLREQLSLKIESLGGAVQSSYNDKVTHAVFLGEDSEKSEEFKCAKDAGKAVVAPAWVELCAAEGTRKDEALFPPADYPMNRLHDPGVNWESLRLMTHTTTVEQDKCSGLKSNVHEWTPGMKEGNSEELKESFRKPEVLMQLRKLDHVLAEESSSTPEKLRLSRASISATREDRFSAALDSSRDHIMTNPPSPCTQGSVSEVISWKENGVSEEEIRRETRRKTQQEQTMQDDEDEEFDIEKKPPKFMFSSLEDVDRARYRGLIESLGGSVSADSFFDIEASHLITLRPARSEKLLGSIASGKWVLHPEYLEVSKSQGRFIEEEPYEWGNPEGVIPMPSVEMERVLSEAIHRWRVRIKGVNGKRDAIHARKPLGAFEGVCAIIHMAEERAAAFRRLVIAGGGTISKAKPPYSSATDATLCLMELGRGQGTVDIESLAKKEIPCLKPLYLNECLIRMDSPDPIEFAIPEYLAKRHVLEK